MSDETLDFDSQAPPWDDWDADSDVFDEQLAIERLNAAVAEARDAGAVAAARLAVIAVGNYVTVSQNWPQLLDRANELLNEIDNTQSRRWG
jgi:hypothetical protein